MDVAETAAIMGCSQGSVKTHCSRAVHSMAATLQKQGLGKKEISAIAHLGVET
jgi:RNA polymerase sigma-70 factor (ECF subfamily)